MLDPKSLALRLATLVRQKKASDRSFKQGQIAADLMRVTRPKNRRVESEEAHLSSLLRGDDRALRRYLLHGDERRDAVLKVFAHHLETTPEALLQGEASESGPQLFHPAWPELGAVEDAWVDRVPGLYGFEDLVRRAKALEPGKPLLIAGPPGSGKSTLLRRLRAALPGLRVVDGPKELGASVEEATRRREPVAIAVEEVSGKQCADLQLGPWTTETIATYLERLSDAAARIPGCRPPPPELAETLREKHLESAVATPRELGFLARSAAESGTLPSSPAELPALLLRARIRAAVSRGAARGQPEDIEQAYAAAMVACFDRDPPGQCFGGMRRAELLEAIGAAAHPTLEELRGMVDRLLAGVRKGRLGPARAALEQAQVGLSAPDSEEVLAALVTARLVRVDGDRVFPKERALAAAACAERLANRPDGGWSALEATLVDASRHAVRAAAAHHLERGRDRIRALLSAPAGTHPGALRFALALAAHGREEADADQVATLVASACALLDRAWATGLFPMDASVETALRVVSRRYRHVLPQLEEEATRKDFLDHLTPAARRIAAAAPTPDEDTLMFDGRTPLRHSLGLGKNASFDEVLKLLLPWQFRERLLGEQTYARRRVDGDVLWDAALEGNERARSIAGWVDDDEHAGALRAVLGWRQRFDALERWGPSDPRRRRQKLQWLVSNAGRGREGGRAAMATRAKEAICRFIEDFGDAPGRRDPLGWTDDPLWLDGLTEARAVRYLELEYEYRLERARQFSLLHLRDEQRAALLDLAQRLHRLGAPEPLRALAAKRSDLSGDKPLPEVPDLLKAEHVDRFQLEAAVDRLARDATAALIAAKDLEGLRPLIADPEARTPALSLIHSPPDPDSSVWLADALGLEWCASHALSDLPPRGPRREAARRWALETASPYRTRATLALLYHPVSGEHEHVSWYLGERPTLHLLRSAVAHPDREIQELALRAVERAAREIKRDATGNDSFRALYERWDPPLRMRGREAAAVTDVNARYLAHQLEDFARTAIERGLDVAPALRSVLELAQDRAVAEPAYDELIIACAGLFQSIGHRAWLGVLVRPFGPSSGDPERASSIRWRVLRWEKLSTLEDRAALNALAKDANQNIRITASRRLLDLDQPDPDRLIAELRASGYFEHGLAGTSHGRDDRAEAIALHLWNREPRALAMANVEAVHRIPAKARSRALLQYPMVAELDPEQGARFLSAVLEAPSSRRGRGHER